jgi:hypothetical protein
MIYMALSNEQLALVFDSFHNLGDLHPDTQAGFARAVCFGAFDFTPDDPDGILFNLIDALGSAHDCLGKEGETRITECFVGIITQLVRLSDAKRKSTVAKPGRRRSRKGAAA